jgi:rhodanese-related sulfurtransferase
MPVVDINAEKLRELIKNEKDNLEIIDVREPPEYAIIHIKNSKLIPMNELEERLDEIDWKKKVVFICRSGSRSKLMASLVAKDKKILNLQYGIYECFTTGKGENLEIDATMIGKYF